MGICGGFQMLGRVIRDPEGVEGAPAEVDGLGLLDVETNFVAEKALRLPTGQWSGVPAAGYEIHHGRITRGPDADDERQHGGSERPGGEGVGMRHHRTG